MKKVAILLICVLYLLTLSSCGLVYMDDSKEKTAYNDAITALFDALDERDNEKETINSSDINLQYVEDGKVEDILKKQNPFGWISNLIGKDEYEVKSEIKYDSAKLQEVINNLKCINNTNVIKPVNASIKYDGDKFVIVDEVLGNVIDKEKVQEVISQAITEGEEKISLDKKDCYINPTYTKNSKKLKESLDTANKYIKTNKQRKTPARIDI